MSLVKLGELFLHREPNCAQPKLLQTNPDQDPGTGITTPLRLDQAAGPVLARAWRRSSGEGTSQALETPGRSSSSMEPVQSGPCSLHLPPVLYETKEAAGQDVVVPSVEKSSGERETLGSSSSTTQFIRKEVEVGLKIRAGIYPPPPFLPHTLNFRSVLSPVECKPNAKECPSYCPSSVAIAMSSKPTDIEESELEGAKFHQRTHSIFYWGVGSGVGSSEGERTTYWQRDACFLLAQSWNTEVFIAFRLEFRIRTDRQ
ncbi:hypothetical protein STEG23_010309 [Scotinomys teguina]